MTQRRLVALVDGHVQGVGFRWWTRGEAVGLGLVGSAENLADGRVSVIAEGPEDALTKLLQRLPSGPGRVDEVLEEWAEPVGEQGFATF